MAEFGESAPTDMTAWTEAKKVEALQKALSALEERVQAIEAALASRPYTP